MFPLPIQILFILQILPLSFTSFMIHFQYFSANTGYSISDHLDFFYLKILILVNSLEIIGKILGSSFGT